MQLTEQQVMEWFDNEVRAHFIEKYRHLARSGAVDSEEQDFTFARAALLLAAEDFHPISTEGKKMLVNLRHF